MDSLSLRQTQENTGSYGIDPNANDSPMPKNKVGRWESWRTFISFLSEFPKTHWLETHVADLPEGGKSNSPMLRSYSEMPGEFCMVWALPYSIAWSACNNHYQILPHGKAATEINRILEMTRSTGESQTASENNLGLVWDSIGCISYMASFLVDLLFTSYLIHTILTSS